MNDLFIETPVKPERVGRAKMPNTSKGASKPAKSYNKTRGEHNKDIVIAILITTVIAFVGGMHFSNNQHAETARAVSAATAVKK
jgi:hypothetical protein